VCAGSAECERVRAQVQAVSESKHVRERVCVWLCTLHALHVSKQPVAVLVRLRDAARLAHVRGHVGERKPKLRTLRQTRLQPRNVQVEFVAAVARALRLLARAREYCRQPVDVQIVLVPDFCLLCKT